MNKKRRMNGYVRVSHKGKREGDNFLSPDIQKDTIRFLAEKNNVELIEPIVEEIDVKGSKPAIERELGRIIEGIEAGESDGLIVWKVSRFSRNLLDGIQSASRIMEVGGTLIGSDLDTSQPMGKAILGFFLGWAQEELEDRQAHWRGVKKRKIKLGVHISGYVPAGYTRDSKTKALIINPEQAKIVRDIFLRRAQGESMTSLTNLANEKKLVGGRGNSTWVIPSISALVRNRVYIGEARGGKDEHGRPYVNPNAHPPIVSVGEWQAAQNVRGMNISQGNPQLLTGFLRCQGCRHVMKYQVDSKRKLAYYYCRKDHSSGICQSPARVSSSLIEEHVLQNYLGTLPQDILAAATADARVEEARLTMERAESEVVL